MFDKLMTPFKFMAYGIKFNKWCVLKGELPSFSKPAKWESFQGHRDRVEFWLPGGGGWAGEGYVEQGYDAASGAACIPSFDLKIPGIDTLMKEFLDQTTKIFAITIDFLPFEEIIKEMKKLPEDIWGVLKFISTHVIGLLKSVFEKIKPIVIAIFTLYKEYTTGSRLYIRTIQYGIMQTIIKTSGNIKDAMIEIIDKIIMPLFNKMSEMMSPIVDALKNFVSMLFKYMGDLMKSLTTFFKNLFKIAYETAQYVSSRGFNIFMYFQGQAINKIIPIGISIQGKMALVYCGACLLLFGPHIMAYSSPIYSLVNGFNKFFLGLFIKRRKPFMNTLPSPSVAT
jgi:hypothetical protein